MKSLNWLLKIPGSKSLLKKYFELPSVSAFRLADINFKNRIGLAAGFDKNAVFLNELEILGFGFIEIGTVTPLPQSGNEKPRLFRLPKDNAIINRMGFNNDGADVISQRLLSWNQRRSKMIIGANIGKNKLTSNADAWKDYETCYLKLYRFVDYFAINVSSPNTPGLRDLQEKDSVEKILGAITRHNNLLSLPLPIFLKLSPDLSKATIDELISVCIYMKITGVIIANTTISRENLSTDKRVIDSIGSGGLSGLPLSHISGKLIDYIHKKYGDKLFIIASGGIFTGDDVKQRLMAGASLVQVWTGFIYKGPGIVKQILRQMQN